MPEALVLHAPAVEATPRRTARVPARSSASIPHAKRCVIGGTFYAGEIKKSIFTLMNDRLPLRGVLPMHCSANVGADGRVAVFFGLSGTGKTTLSADPERRLIGDDEHGWSDDGVFNFEGGCYAKVIRLSEEAEPEIFRTTRTFGTVLENVIAAERGVLDLDDDTKTENTRAAYKLEQIANHLPTRRAGHPSSVVMLTADAFGVLPPIARLTREQALFYFLSGYTAKVAGTEIGVTEPQATFSTCFGAPFLPQSPSVYARLLGERLEAHGADRLAREHRLDGWAIRRGRADADRGHAGDAARGPLGRARGRSVSHGSGLRLRGAGRRCPASSRACSSRARRGGTPMPTTRRRRSSPRCSPTTLLGLQEQWTGQSPQQDRRPSTLSDSSGSERSTQCVDFARAGCV